MTSWRNSPAAKSKEVSSGLSAASAPLRTVMERVTMVAIGKAFMACPSRRLGLNAPRNSRRPFKKSRWGFQVWFMDSLRAP